ncbi:MAG: hypothetical protein DLM57_08045 [Pseudonocardiales bacterium]|nr:MAG: hypothetical protein DLM57_08045 [Pseudonocardiales bacterium]
MSSEFDNTNRGEQLTSAVPAAVPAASTTNPTDAPTSAAQGNLRTGKSSADPGGEGTPRGRSGSLRSSNASLRSKTGKLAILALRQSMPERDLTILRSLAAHRFLTTRQITALHFADTGQDQYGSRVARKVLKRLDEASVLSHLDQRIGGFRAGSDGYVWRVGPVGDRLLRFGTSDTTRRGRRYEPSTWFLGHCLAIAELHVTLAQTARDGRFDLTSLELEPSTWREYQGSFGERRILKPDLGAVTASGEYEDHFWFEIDLGNEHLPTILDKCRAYEAYRRTGLEDERRGEGVFPIVVWVMHTAERAARLRAAIAESRDVDASPFRVTTPDEMAEMVAGGAE